jgi:hypothetical protein
LYIQLDLRGFAVPVIVTAKLTSDNDDYRGMQGTLARVNLTNRTVCAYTSDFSRHAGLAANPPEAFEGAYFR